MTTYAALSHTTFIGGYDMTGDLNQTETSFEWDPLESTVFGSVARSRKAGLEDVQSTVNGFFDAAEGAVDETTFNAMANVVQAVTQTPSGTELDVAYLYQARQFTYQTFGDVGQLVPFTLSMQGAKGNGSAGVGAVRGRLLKAKGAVSATGATGSPFELGALAAGQYAYAALHCFGTPGTSITLVLESAPDNTFAAPTTQMTLGPITAAGGVWGTRVAGPVVDTWWRLRISAVTGTWTIACAAGIK